MRYVVVILGVVLLIAALVVVKFKQISQLISFGKKMEQAGAPPEPVGTSTATSQSWEASLNAVGTIAPVQGVSISNDAPGVVTRIDFESGDLVKEGKVLVQLDSTVEQAQLGSVNARRLLATQTLERDRALVTSGSLPASQLEAEESALKSANSDLAGIQAQIARKTVRAPFSGRLGIRTVNVGQYLNPGTALTVLVGVDAVFVDFAFPQQQIGSVKPGMPVHVTIEGAKGLAGDGTILALDPTIDSMSRTVKLRATIPNKEEKLHPGMFANVSVILPKQDALVVVPLTAVVHASYGDSVFIVEEDQGKDGAPPQPGPDGKPYQVARQQFVKLGPERGDFVAVLDGVKTGQVLVTAGAFKLRNGARVAIDNTIAPKPELAPKPENH